MMNFFLYGPPLTGKSTLGRSLAASLGMPFVDLDSFIEETARRSIADIFQREGEAGFRKRELEALSGVVQGPPRVIALGGGALLSSFALKIAESSGQVLCLDAALETLQARMPNDGTVRPLISENPAARLQKLLSLRQEHYRSFRLQLNTDRGSIAELTWQAQAKLGAYRVSGMGQPYDIRITPGGLGSIGLHCRARNLNGPVVVVSDENVGELHGENLLKGLHNAGYEASLFLIPAGEEHKNIDTVLKIWHSFLEKGVERGSTVVALGGGVVGDMVGFAAATFLRGVAWVNVPTTLLAMVDSSLGGKTGIDLPQAKNMVGAFYPPRLVLADPQVLGTLPARELRGGLAEVIKHGIIADPTLFELCSTGLDRVQAEIDTVVHRGMAVKVKVIEADPYEKGLRQGLNLGHTIGHGIEIASGFRLGHGEAVAAGMAIEAQMAEEIGLAAPGLSRQIAEALEAAGLPSTMPLNLALDRVIAATRLDKKRAAGQIHFALPRKIGEVRTGVIIEDWPALLKRITGMRSTA
jgi:3-dehydroquinate synthase